MKFISIIGLMLLTAITPVRAHAFLDHADPKVGSQVKVSPATVKIWFTMEVNAAATSIAVYDSTGKEVDHKDSRRDPANPSLMTVTLPTLPKGTYQVAWKATCPYGHHTEGKFTFEIL